MKPSSRIWLFLLSYSALLCPHFLYSQALNPKECAPKDTYPQEWEQILSGPLDFKFEAPKTSKAAPASNSLDAPNSASVSAPQSKSQAHSSPTTTSQAASVPSPQTSAHLSKAQIQEALRTLLRARRELFSQTEATKAQVSSLFSKAGITDQKIIDSTRNDLLSVLSHLLSWNNREFYKTYEEQNKDLPDYSLKSDPTLAKLLGADTNVYTSLTDYLFSGALKEPRVQKALKDLRDQISNFGVIKSILLSLEDAKAIDQESQMISGMDSEGFISRPKPPANTSFLQDFRARYDERKNQGLIPANYAPIYQAKIEDLKKKNENKISLTHLIEAFNFNASEMAEAQKKKEARDYFITLETEHALLKSADLDFYQRGQYYAHHTSIEEQMDDRLQGMASELGLDRQILSFDYIQSLGSLKKVISQTEDPRIDLGTLESNLSAAETQALKEEIRKHLNELSSIQYSDGYGREEVWKNQPFANPKNFMPKEAYFVPLVPARLKRDGEGGFEKIPEQPAYWALPSAQGMKKISEEEFKTHKQTAINKEADKIWESLKTKGFQIQLLSLLKQGTRYNETGFLSKPREAPSGKWTDPILERARMGVGGDVEITPELRSKFALALYIASQDMKKPLTSLPLKYADLLTWSQHDLEGLAVVYSIIENPQILKPLSDRLPRLSATESLQLFKLAKEVAEFKASLEQALGFDPKLKIKDEKAFSELQKKLQTLVNEKRKLLPGVSLYSLGYFGGSKDKTQGAGLSSEPIKPYSLEEFRRIMIEEPGEPKPDLPKSMDDLASQMNAALKEAQEKHERLEKNLKNKASDIIDELKVVSLKNLLELKLEIFDALTAAGKLKPQPATQEVRKELAELLAKNPSQQDLIKFLSAQFLKVTGEENKITDQYLTEILEAPKTEVDKKVLASLEARLGRDAFNWLKKNSFFNLIIFLQKDTSQKAGQVKDLNLSQWSLSELEALDFIVNRYGWTKATITSRGTQASYALWDWVLTATQRNPDKPPESPALSIQDSADLLRAAQELSIAEGLVPTLWGPDWKQNLNQLLGHELSPAELRQIGTVDALSILGSLKAHQTEASRMFSYNKAGNFFQVPKELQAPFEMEIEPITRLARMGIPTDPKHLDKLKALGAQYVWSDRKEKALEQVGLLPKEKQEAAKKEIEGMPAEGPASASAALPSPRLMNEYLQERNRTELAKSAKAFKLEDGSLYRSPFATRAILEANKYTMNSLVQGLRPYEYFIHDFFDKPETPVTKDLAKYFTSTSTEDPGLQALALIGFNTKSAAFERTFTEIRKRNPELYADLDQDALKFLLAGRKLWASLDQGPLKREDFQKIMRAWQKNDKLLFSLLGVKNGLYVEGSEISSRSAQDFLTKSGIQVSVNQDTLDQLSNLRAMILSAQVLFPNYADSYSQSILRYAVPIVFEEVKTSAEKTEFGNSAFNSLDFYSRAYHESLEAAQKMTNLTELTNLAELEKTLATMALEKKVDLSRFDNEFRTLAGQFHDLYRILYGNAYDQGRLGTFEGYEADLNYRGPWAQGRQKLAEERVHFYVKALNKRIQSSVEQMRSSINAEALKSPGAQVLRDFLNKLSIPLEVKVVESGEFRRFKIIYPLEVKQKVAATKLSAAMPSASDLVRFARFKETPLTYEASFVAFVPKALQKAKTPYEFTEALQTLYPSTAQYPSFEEASGRVKLEKTLASLGEKRSVLRFAENRITNLKKYLEELKANPQFDPKALAQMLVELSDQGTLNLNTFFGLLEAAERRIYETKIPRIIANSKEENERLMNEANKGLEMALKNVASKNAAKASDKDLLDLMESIKRIQPSAKPSNSSADSREKAFPGTSQGGLKSIYAEANSSFQEQDKKISALFLASINQLLTDPNGKALNANGRFAPYSHRFEVKDKDDASLKILQSLFDYVEDQGEAFFYSSNRKASVEALIDEMYGDRYEPLKNRLSALAQMFENSLGDLLASENQSRQALKAYEGSSRLNSADLKTLYACLIEESLLKKKKASSAQNKDPSAKAEADQKEKEEPKNIAILVTDLKVLQGCFKTPKITDEMFKSEAFKAQMNSLVQRHNAILQSARTSGAMMLLADTEIVRQQIQNKLMVYVKDLSRIEGGLQIALSKAISGLENANQTQLEKTYKDLKVRREAREKLDDSWAVWLGKSVVDIAAHGIKNMADEVYRMVIENIPIGVSAYLGDSAFSATTAFFSQYEGSNYTDEALSKSGMKSAASIGGDMVGFGITLMSLGTVSAVRTAIRGAVEETGKGLLKTQVQLVAAKAATTEALETTAKEAARELGQRATRMTLQESLKDAGGAASKASLDSGKSKASRLFEMSSQARQIAKIYGMRLGVDSVWLTTGATLAGLAALGTLGDSPVEDMAKGTIQNIQIMATFMASQMLVRKMPWIGNLIQASIFSSVGSGLTKNGLLFLDQELNPRDYEKYLKPENFKNGIFDTSVLSKDPEGARLLKEYQEDMKARAELISSAFLSALFIGGPAAGRYFDYRNAKNIESGQSSGIWQTLSGAYGSRPDRIYQDVFQLRFEKLKAANDKLPNPKTLDEVKQEAEKQVQTQFWTLWHQANPDAQIADLVARWKLAGYDVHGMREQALEALVRNYKFSFHRENLLDSIPGIGRAFDKPRELSLKELVDRFNKAWDEGSQRGDLALIGSLDEVWGRDIPKQLKAFQAFNEKLEQLKTQPQDLQVAELQRILDLTGGREFWNTQAGKVVLHEIILPRLRHLEGREALGEILGVNLASAKADAGAGGKPLLSADLLAKVLEVSERSPMNPARMSSPNASGLSEFRNPEGNLLAQMKTLDDGSRELTIPGVQTLKVPPEVEIIVLNNGRIRLVRDFETKAETEIHQAFARSALSDLKVNVLEGPSKGISETLNAQQAGAALPARWVEFNLPKPGSSSMGSLERMTSGTQRASALLVELNPQMDIAFPGNGVALLRFKGQASRNFLLPEGFEIVRHSEDSFRYRDRFGQETEIFFRENRVEVFELRGNHLQASRAFERNGKPCSLADFELMLKTYSGLHPSEVLLSIRLMNLTPPNVQSTTSSPRIAELELQEAIEILGLPKDSVLHPDMIKIATSHRLGHFSAERSQERLSQDPKTAPLLARVAVEPTESPSSLLPRIDRAQLKRFLESKESDLKTLQDMPPDQILAKFTREQIEFAYRMSRINEMIQEAQKRSLEYVQTQRELAAKQTLGMNPLESPETAQRKAQDLRARHLNAFAQRLLSADKAAHDEMARSDQMRAQVVEAFVANVSRRPSDQTPSIEVRVDTSQGLLKGLRQLDQTSFDAFRSRLSREELVYIAGRYISRDAWLRANGDIAKLSADDLSRIDRQAIEWGLTRENFQGLIRELFPDQLIRALDRASGDLPSLQNQLRSIDDAARLLQPTAP